jgi:tetratricopeptide (TPR) repeat protein
MAFSDDAARLIETAKNHYERKDYAAAAGQYRLAADVYRSAGDVLTAAEMDNNCSVAMAMAGDHASAWEAARGTDQVFLTAGDWRRAGLACGNQAAALEGLGKTKEALEQYQRSADLLKKTGDSTSRAAVLKSLAALQARHGDSLQALAAAQAALNVEPHLSTKEKLLKKLIDIPIRMITRR